MNYRVCNVVQVFDVEEAEVWLQRRLLRHLYILYTRSDRALCCAEILQCGSFYYVLICVLLTTLK